MYILKIFFSYNIQNNKGEAEKKPSFEKSLEF